MTTTTNDMATITERLIAEAEAQHTQHAQYDSHWDGWVAVRAIKDIKVRGTVVLAKGEFALMDPTTIDTPTPESDPYCKPSAYGKTWATFYFARSLGGMNTTHRVDQFDTQI